MRPPTPEPAPRLLLPHHGWCEHLTSLSWYVWHPLHAYSYIPHLSLTSVQVLPGDTARRLSCPRLADTALKPYLTLPYLT